MNGVFWKVDHIRSGLLRFFGIIHIQCYRLFPWSRMIRRFAIIYVAETLSYSMIGWLLISSIFDNFSNEHEFEGLNLHYNNELHTSLLVFPEFLLNVSVIWSIPAQEFDRMSKSVIFHCLYTRQSKLFSGLDSTITWENPDSLSVIVDCVCSYRCLWFANTQ